METHLPSHPPLTRAGRFNARHNRLLAKPVATPPTASTDAEVIETAPSSTPRPPRTEITNPHPKCIGVRITPDMATITHYHYAEPRHYNLRMPRAQWEEIMLLLAHGHTDFIHNCDLHIATLHHLDAVPAA